VEMAFRNSLAIFSVIQGADFEGTATFVGHNKTSVAYITEFHENVQFSH
jgi:hypothetical protein